MEMYHHWEPRHIDWVMLKTRSERYLWDLMMNHTDTKSSLSVSEWMNKCMWGIEILTNFMTTGTIVNEKAIRCVKYCLCSSGEFLLSAARIKCLCVWYARSEMMWANCSAKKKVHRSDRLILIFCIDEQRKMFTWVSMINSRDRKQSIQPKWKSIIIIERFRVIIFTLQVNELIVSIWILFWRKKVDIDRRFIPFLWKAKVKLKEKTYESVRIAIIRQIHHNHDLHNNFSWKKCSQLINFYWCLPIAVLQMNLVKRSAGRSYVTCMHIAW